MTHILWTMKNEEIAEIFERMGDLMEILGEDRFRVNSYRRSARSVREWTEAIEDLAAQNRLSEIPGVGKSTAEKIDVYLETGKVPQLDQLMAKVPPNLIDMLTVPGLGPKTVAKLWKQGNVTSLDELRKALEKDPDHLTQIEGMGAKKVQQIRQSLEFIESARGRIRLGEADALAAALVEAIKKCGGVGRVTPAGSLRRGKETIGDIDILCEAAPGRTEKVIESFTKSDNVRRVLVSGKTKGSVVLEGDVQADLRVVPKESFGAALAYFTGSKEHNIHMRELAISRGMKLNEYGLFKGDKQLAGEDEEGIFRILGLPYIPPQLREDRGEVEAGLHGSLPELVTLRDIRGDMHMHTVASDGANTIEEMIRACRDRGYQYLAISEHSRSQIQANGLDEKRLARHAEDIRNTAEKFKDILVLTSIEVDIFKDGSLDFSPDVLSELDFVTASAHSALSLKRTEATRRLIRAIEHPHVHCIGHPSGRLINARAGMELDIEKIAAAAAANNVALEVNAHYYRLDLRDTHVRAATNAGAKIVISTDAHNIGQLDMMRYGVTTARRGWATPPDVINTYTPSKLRKWLRER